MHKCILIYENYDSTIKYLMKDFSHNILFFQNNDNVIINQMLSSSESIFIYGSADFLLNLQINRMNLFLLQSTIDCKILHQNITNLLPKMTIPPESFKNLTVDLNKEVLYLNNVAIPTTSFEFKLISLFIKNPNKTLSRKFIIQNIQGQNFAVSSRTIDTHMVKLRKKINNNFFKFIKSKHGKGYILS